MRKSLLSAFAYFTKNVGTPITPTDLNKHLGVGDYASRHISQLRRRGCEISVAKDGRSVTSYTYVTGPAVLPDNKKVKVAKDKGSVKAKGGTQVVKPAAKKGDGGTVVKPAKVKVEKVEKPATGALRAAVAAKSGKSLAAPVKKPASKKAVAKGDGGSVFDKTSIAASSVPGAGEADFGEVGNYAVEQDFDNVSFSPRELTAA